VHREIKQNRKKANVGGVEPGGSLRARFAEWAVMEFGWTRADIWRLVHLHSAPAGGWL